MRDRGTLSLTLPWRVASYRRFPESPTLFIKILLRALAGSHHLLAIIRHDHREPADLEETCHSIRADLPA